MDVIRSRRLIARRFLVLAVFLGCGARDQPDPDVTLGRRAAATAGATWQQVLQGKVIASSLPTIASTPGEPAVEQDGSASYRVPLWVPDGIRGLQPSLALEYNSEAGIGVLGPRWRVSGLSAIVRCPQTRAQDGMAAPINFRGDTFCLDGQRLVRINGTANGTGEFRTERNPYAKIVVTAATTPDQGGVQTFKVYQPDGRIFWYGRSTISRLEGTASWLPYPAIYGYYLDRIEDRFGNLINIGYYNGYNGGALTQTVRELVPYLIQYGTITSPGVSSRSIQFTYEAPLTDTAAQAQAEAARTRYVGGLGIVRHEYLKQIDMYGPDIAGTAILKSYKFIYDVPPGINLDRVLSLIYECAGAGGCKVPTSLNWEQLNYGYNRVDLANQGFTYTPPYGARGGRFVVQDIDGDGRDDVAYLQSAFCGSSCSSWLYRPALPDPSGVRFGDQVALPFGPYYNYASHFQDKYPGDPLFADLNGDGRTDAIIPDGEVDNGNLLLNGYRAFLSTGSTTWGPAISLDDSSLDHSGAIGVGDIDGDGLPEVVRPKTSPAGSQWAVSVQGSGTLVPKVVPENFGAGTGRLWLFDVDNDGTTEVVRDVWEPSSLQLTAMSPTMSTSLVTPITLPTQVGTPPDGKVWLLDANGDGLQDIAWVINGYPSGIYLAFNQGNGGFGPPIIAADNLAPSQQPGVNWQWKGDEGVRVVDYNLDGRDDLLLVDPHGVPPYPTLSPAAAGNNYGSSYRTNVTVLFSDGAGHFTPSATYLPIGVGAGYNGYDDRWGARTSVVADVNGDGLPDLLQIEYVSGGYHAVAYVRQGKPPEVLKTITEGTTRTTAFEMAPVSDSSVYTSNPASCASDPQHLSCLTRGRWLTKSLTVSGGTVSNTETYAYADGLTDRGGRGFLGFKSRDIYRYGSDVHTHITYDPGNRQPLGNGYHYPYAFSPQTTRTDTEVWSGSNSHSWKTAQFYYQYDARADNTYDLTPSGSDNTGGDCPTDWMGGCAGPTRSLGSVRKYSSFDAYGNLTFSAAYYYDQNNTFMGVDSDSIVYSDPQTDTWLVQLPNNHQHGSCDSSWNCVDRRVDFTLNLTTGEIDSLELGKYYGGDTHTHLIRTFTRDSLGRLSTITETGDYSGEVRTTGFQYLDADGVYPSTITNALGQPTRLWRHPGTGWVVETDDPNYQAAITTYDTFGRPLSQTSPSGESVTIGYSTSSLGGGGVNVWVRPEGKATREIAIRLDPFGNEIQRDVPIDSVRHLVLATAYDAYGRQYQKTITSTANGSSTVLNAISTFYDSMDRVQGICAQSSSCDPAICGAGPYCSWNVYNGLSTTAIDETGKQIKRTFDSKGRLSIETATLEAGDSNATFIYGPFDQLEHEMVDSVAQTDITYDVRGRATVITRKGAGTRRTGYNAFDEAYSTEKLSPNGTSSDYVYYTRDALGRVSEVDGPNRGYRLAWDHDSQGQAVPNGIGRLIETSPYDGKTVATRFDYGPQGLPISKTWQVPVLGTTLSYSAQFSYDPQGRLDTTTYPHLASDTAPLQVKAVYDDYNGAVDLLKDGATGPTIWQSLARNALGESSQESMQLAGSSIVTLGTDYYLQDGRRHTATLSNSSMVTAGVSYSYRANGLPATFGMSGAGGNWTSTYDYDSLQRLTSWQPTASAPSVVYHYDAEGSLTSRVWSGETASYASSATARTVTVTRGAQVTTDTYQLDAFGRIYDTPTTTLTYNDTDQVVSLTEKTNGNRVDRILRDALDQRVITNLGASDYLLTLDDLYEQENIGNTIESRWHLRAGERLIGDIVLSNDPNSGFARVGTFFLEDNVHSVVGEASVHANDPTYSSVTGRPRRDPYGNLIADVQNPYLPGDPTSTEPDGSSRDGFGGHARDAHWGVVDMMSRFYSPRLGRFIAPDGLLLPDPFERTGHNPFAYVNNSPTHLYDPDGHLSFGDVWHSIVVAFEGDGGQPQSTNIDDTNQTASPNDKGSAGIDPASSRSESCTGWRCRSGGTSSSSPRPAPASAPAHTNVPHTVTGFPTSQATGGAEGTANHLLRVGDPALNRAAQLGIGDATYRAPIDTESLDDKATRFMYRIITYSNRCGAGESQACGFFAAEMLRNGIGPVGSFGNPLSSVTTTEGSGAVVRVGRWMSVEEHEAMIASGRVQESTLNGVTSVSVPPDPAAWAKQTTAPRYVEFNVSAAAVKGAGNNSKIYGPTSLFGPHLGITEMPAAANIELTACRVPYRCP